MNATNQIIRNFFVGAILIIVLCSCERAAWKKSLSFPNVEYIRSFPRHIVLTEGKEASIPVVELLDVRCCDSIILISSEDHGQGYLTGIQKNGFKFLGSFLNKGNGPNESNDPIFFCDAIIEEQDNQWWAYLYFRNVLHKVDIVSSIISNSLVVKDTCNIPDKLVCLKLPENGYYTISSYKDRSGYTRELTSATYSDYLLLNDYHISFRKDPNIIYFFSAYSVNNNKIIEASLFLNTINIYSSFGNKTKTICYGDKLERIIEKEALSEKEYLPKTFDGLRTYDSFFVCLYKGSLENYSHPHLLFFDYEGLPLIDVMIPSAVFSFDIDLDDKILYVIDDTIDSLVTFDISSVIDTILQDRINL